MRISPHWLRELAPIKVDDRRLGADLTAAGLAVEKVYENGIFEMEITTNRVDAMNHYGIAREISAIYDVDLKPLQPKLPTVHGKSNVSVTIDVPQYCARFTGQEIRDVKIGRSLGTPAYQERGFANVVQRFSELDQKLINNAADATNYVMLLMGKPTHAFDLDKLAGRKIIIRNARPGEILKTLDGVERKLHPEDIVVADTEKAVGLAGTIGGWDSMITESTKNVFIESAWWEPAAVRSMARRHGIHTDASHRFERGADWASCPLSTDLVAEIILESGGELVGGKIDVIARKIGHKPVHLSLSEVLRILGKEIAPAEIERILSRLGFKLEQGRSKHNYVLGIPTWRLDVEREIDIIEEIARIHGYNNFPNTLPSFAGGVIELPQTEKQEKLRNRLLALGYNEALSSTFVAREQSEQFSPDAVVEIANPLSEEASAMRTSLLPGMLDMVAYNLNRDVQDVRLFEYGHVYSSEASATTENPALCFSATVGVLRDGKPDPVMEFRRFKGDVEKLLELFDGEVNFNAETGPTFHRGRAARATIAGEPVARFGLLDPSIAAARKLKQDIYIAEIDANRLLALELRVPHYKKLSRFPTVHRDFSFIFEESVSYVAIQQAIAKLGIAELRSVEPAEIFRGGNVPRGKFSALISTTFQSSERTLRDDEVHAWSTRIIEALHVLGGTLRA